MRTKPEHAQVNHKAKPHILTLAMAAAIGPLAMNVFLPSLPGITSYFNTSSSTAQLSVSLFLFSTALLSLVVGPMSDKFGRRPVMLWCFVIMLAGTLLCIFASTIELFLLGRIIQASAAGGMIISRAIARDIASKNEAASLIGYITMGTALVPMLGPVLGGYLDELFGWHAAFYLIFATALGALIVVYFDLDETNHQKSSSFGAQVKEYPELLTSRRFWGYTASSGLSSGAFFAFLGGAPLVANQVLGLSPSEFGFYFAFAPIGYMSGNFISGRMSQQMGINKMMLSGCIAVAGGVLLAIILFAAGIIHPLSFFAPMFFMGFGNGLTLPSANAGIVSVRPHIAGSASGLGGALQLGGGAALAVFAGYIFVPENGALPLLWVMFSSAFCAIFATLYVIRIDAMEKAKAAKTGDK